MLYIFPIRVVQNYIGKYKKKKKMYEKKSRAKFGLDLLMFRARAKHLNF